MTDHIDIRLVFEPGDSVVMFQLDVDRELELRAETIAHVLREHRGATDSRGHWNISEITARAAIPHDRAAAVRWARKQATRIIQGDFDRGGPLELFDATQQIELQLCRWQWLDSNYPSPVARFVEGWNVSGDDTDREIRAAAAALAADASDDGPPLQPHRD